MESWQPEAPQEKQTEFDTDPSEEKSRRGRSPAPTYHDYTEEECIAYGEKLKGMETLYSLPNDDKVRQMQFSPDGSWLAVCYEYECRMYNVEVCVVRPLSVLDSVHVLN